MDEMDENDVDVSSGHPVRDGQELCACEGLSCEPCVRPAESACGADEAAGERGALDDAILARDAALALARARGDALIGAKAAERTARALASREACHAKHCQEWAEREKKQREDLVLALRADQACLARLTESARVEPQLRALIETREDQLEQAHSALDEALGARDRARRAYDILAGFVRDRLSEAPVLQPWIRLSERGTRALDDAERALRGET